MLITLVVVGFFVGTINQGAAEEYSPLVKAVSSCLCAGGSNAYQNGCKLYMANRLQSSKAPAAAATSAEAKCDSLYGLTKPAKKAQCKSGVAFLRGKE